MFEVHAEALGEGNAAELHELEQIFGGVVGAALPFAAIVLLVMILYGGFQLITSGDNPDKIQGAKNTITYAILGVVLISLSYLIIFIIANFTGATQILNFQILN